MSSVGDVLLDILVVLIAAKVAAEVAERIGFPPVVAEILAGVAIGPSVLDFVGHDDTLLVLGEIGVILLLLQVGMEMDLDELAAVGRSSLSVAAIGVVVPMASGFAVGQLFGHDTNTSLFLGAALAATSVGITARVFRDLRALASVEARTVLGAAVADDVLGLVILTVVVRIVSEGSVSTMSVLGIVAVAIGFLVVTAFVGSKAAPALFRFIDRNSRSAGTLVALALAFTLAFAQLAEAAKLAPIVGAFVAGLALSKSSESERITRELAPVGHLFIPVFFLEIGIAARVEEFFDLEVLGVAGALLAVAVVGKLVAAVGAVGSPGDKPLIGIGMLPRGEVGLIFATIGLQEGVLGRDLYAALLLVVLATTLLAPPLLRMRLHRVQRAHRAAPAGPRPDGGWLDLRDGVVELAARPPEPHALVVGLEAALAIAAEHRRPGPTLLDYLGSLGETQLPWDPRATELLFEVLEHGDARAWRFLDVTGLLERSLPELAEALRRRREDPFVVDPASASRFALVDDIRELVAHDQRAGTELAALEHPEWLHLAALIIETAGEVESPVDLARRLVKRLDLGAAAEQEIALLVGEPALLRAAAKRVDALDEERVFSLASHLDRPERARALYLLTLGLGALDAVERTRLDELYALVLVALNQPDLTGRDARNLLERRRTEALRLVGYAPSLHDVRERIAHAPRAYLLSQDAADVARQAALLEPVPPRGQARARVSALSLDLGAAPGASTLWRIEVACRDRPGLLAHVSGVLAGERFSVEDASIATWPDGGALESFRVRAPVGVSPDPARLEQLIVEAFREPLISEPNPEASASFDDEASPWYTLCEVRARDTPGLLHAITVGLAAAGADVHSARVRTVGSEAVDTFELTDRNGRKLDGSVKPQILAALAGGVRGGRRSWLARRNGR